MWDRTALPELLAAGRLNPARWLLGADPALRALDSTHAIDHGRCIGDCVAVPGDVLVGTNQHELAAIEVSGRFELQNFERHVALARGFLEHARALARSEIEEREALAELVVDGASRRQPEMRRPRARSVERRVSVPPVGRRIILVGPHDRRRLVALAELNADGEILWAVLLHDLRAEGAPRGVRRCAVVLEMFGQDPAVHDAGAS